MSRRFGSGGRPLTARPPKLPRCRAGILQIGDLLYTLKPPSGIALKVIAKNSQVIIALNKRSGREISISISEIVELL